MKKTIPCHCTTSKNKAVFYNGKLKTPEGNWINCPYCHGTKEKTIEIPHSSHKMSKWTTEIRCVSSEPRFYRVRSCKVCGLEELNHAAGHFLNGLTNECEGQ